MGLKRYLIYFSYVGTYFRGVQRQAPRNQHDPSTVQGLIEYALERMKPENKPIALLASRTDSGVHALKSALTVDLDFAIDRKPINIHHFLNHFFDDTDLPIRVSDVLWVPWELNCRKAPIWRRYVYRFAVLKPNVLPKEKTDTHTLPIPVSEYNRCHFVSETKFDLESVIKACEVFVGPQDYVAFLGKPNSRIHDENLTTVRILHKVFIERALPYIPSELNDYYNYYHLTCEGKSFIYNQIRKMVAILLSVAQGKMTVDDVRLMFIDPSPASWPKFVEMAPACGLYLTDVFYHPKELELPNNIKESILNPPLPTHEQEKEIKNAERQLSVEIHETKKEKIY